MSDGGPDASPFTTRRATAGEASTVLGILDGANLETDAAAVRAAIERGAAFVAERSAASGGTALGVLVLDGEEITYIAVRPRRRGQGIGTALVRAAADERGTLTAAFDPGVEPFYAALGFEIESADGEDGRLRGRGPADPG